MNYLDYLKKAYGEKAQLLVNTKVTMRECKKLRKKKLINHSIWFNETKPNKGR